MYLNILDVFQSITVVIHIDARIFPFPLSLKLTSVIPTFVNVTIGLHATKSNSQL